MDEPKPAVTLTGEDGNAFSVIGICRRAARKAGWNKERIDNLTNEMTSGDYNHLLQTAMLHFDVN